MTTKNQPDIVIERLGTHLMKITNTNDNSVKFKWNWDVLIDEVNLAIASIDNVKANNGTKKTRGRPKKSSTV